MSPPKPKAWHYLSHYSVYCIAALEIPIFKENFVKLVKWNSRKSGLFTFIINIYIICFKRNAGQGDGVGVCSVFTGSESKASLIYFAMLLLDITFVLLWYLIEVIIISYISSHTLEALILKGRFWLIVCMPNVNMSIAVDSRRLRRTQTRLQPLPSQILVSSTQVSSSTSVALLTETSLSWKHLTNTSVIYRMTFHNSL